MINDRKIEKPTRKVLIVGDADAKTELLLNCNGITRYAKQTSDSVTQHEGECTKLNFWNIPVRNVEDIKNFSKNATEILIVLDAKSGGTRDGVSCILPVEQTKLIQMVLEAKSVQPSINILVVARWSPEELKEILTKDVDADFFVRCYKNILQASVPRATPIYDFSVGNEEAISEVLWKIDNFAGGKEYLAAKAAAIEEAKNAAASVDSSGCFSKCFALLFGSSKTKIKQGVKYEQLSQPQRGFSMENN